MKYALTTTDTLAHHVKHRGYGITFCGKATNAFLDNLSKPLGKVDEEFKLCQECQDNAGATYVDELTGELLVDCLEQPETTTVLALVSDAEQKTTIAEKAVKTAKKAATKAKAALVDDGGPYGVTPAEELITLAKKAATKAKAAITRKPARKMKAKKKR